MDFKSATDELLVGVTLQDVAVALGVSVQSVRQARVAEGAAGRRPPPQGWAGAVARLAKARAKRLGRLAERMVMAE